MPKFNRFFIELERSFCCQLTSIIIFGPQMRATRFVIALCLLLLGGKALDAGAVSQTHPVSFAQNLLQDIPRNQPVLETSFPINEKHVLFCDEVDDEDERNAFVKKYKELNRYVAIASPVQLLHHYYQAPKAIAVQSGTGSFPRYILLRTLRV